MNKENLNEKYILVDYVSGEHAVWDGGILLFDTPEDAMKHNDIFKKNYNLSCFSIIPVNIYKYDLAHNRCVNYNDIVNDDEYNLFKNSPDIFPNRPPYMLSIDMTYIRWDCDYVILFNSNEEINEFINRLNDFFDDKLIRCNRVSNFILSLDTYVYYHDITNTDNFEEKIKMYQICNDQYE